MRFNLSSDDVKTCIRTNLVKERNPQDFYLKNSKNPTSSEQVKLVEVFKKYPKLEALINFK